jgi:hypothetical protein
MTRFAVRAVAVFRLAASRATPMSRCTMLCRWLTSKPTSVLSSVSANVLLTRKPARPINAKITPKAMATMELTERVPVSEWS